MKTLVFCFLLLASNILNASDFSFAWNPVIYQTPDAIPHAFVWDSASVKMTIDTANQGYNQSQNSYEVKTQINDTTATSLFPVGSNKGIVYSSVVKGATIQASVRPIASSSWVCDRVNIPDCDKGSWVSLPSQSASDPNEGYDSSKFFYEFQTKKNSDNWNISLTPPNISNVTQSINLVPGDNLIVQVRTRTPSDFVCDRVNIPDCDKSAWISFPSLPSNDTPIVYLGSPNSIVVSSQSSESGGTGLPVQFNNIVNIGSPDINGSISESNNIYTIKAGGGDLWGNSDSFFFAANPSTLTSTTIIAKVVSFSDDNTGDWSKVGIQIRLGIAANSKNVSVLVSHKTSSVSLQYRSAVGGITREIEVLDVSPPVWLKLTRATSSFTGSYSSDGITWNSIGTISTTMSGTTYKGLFGAKNSSSLAPITASFSSLTGF